MLAAETDRFTNLEAYLQCLSAKNPKQVLLMSRKLFSMVILASAYLLAMVLAHSFQAGEGKGPRGSATGDLKDQA